MWTVSNLSVLTGIIFCFSFLDILSSCKGFIFKRLQEAKKAYKTGNYPESLLRMV